MCRYVCKLYCCNVRLMVADCACGTRGWGVPEGDGLPLVKAGPRGMGACIPRRYVCTHMHTHTCTHTHMYTLIHQTCGHAHTPYSIPLIHIASVYVHVHICIPTHTPNTWTHTPHSLMCFHIAPPFTTSGKINLENAVTRWKWGVGRLIAECTKTPIVIPVWHVGMEDILPTRSPYIPQLFKVRAAKHIQDVVPHLF